jgi:hypothetical protein
MYVVGNQQYLTFNNIHSPVFLYHSGHVMCFLGRSLVPGPWVVALQECCHLHGGSGPQRHERVQSNLEG